MQVNILIKIGKKWLQTEEKATRMVFMRERMELHFEVDTLRSECRLNEIKNNVIRVTIRKLSKFERSISATRIQSSRMVDMDVRDTHPDVTKQATFGVFSREGIQW